MYSVRKKNWENIANVTKNATRFEPRNERERKKTKSTIGARERSSIRTNAASPTAASTNSPITTGDPQCQLLPSTSASTSAVRLAVSVTIPGQATDRWTVSSRLSFVATSV